MRGAGAGTARWLVAVTLAALACALRGPAGGPATPEAEVRALAAVIDAARPAAGATVVVLRADSTRDFAGSSIGRRLAAEGVVVVDPAYRPGPDTTLLLLSRPRQDSAGYFSVLVDQRSGTRGGTAGRQRVYLATVRCDARHCVVATLQAVEQGRVRERSWTRLTRLTRLNSEGLALPIV